MDYLYGLEPGEEHVIEFQPGVQLYLGLEAIGKPDEEGMRTVMATLNGQLRPVFVRDRSITVDAVEREKADLKNPAHVAAPFSGSVTIRVEEGEQVEQGQTVATIEAMKMEAGITAAVGGTVERIAISSPSEVGHGDLLLVVKPEGASALVGEE